MKKQGGVLERAKEQLELVKRKKEMQEIKLKQEDPKEGHGEH